MPAGIPGSCRMGTESHLLLFNHSASTTTFGVSISNGVQIWSKRYQVTPFAIPTVEPQPDHR